MPACVLKSVLMLATKCCKRPSHCPAVRATLGSRSGPNTTSATTAISSISLKPISNMAVYDLLWSDLVSPC